MFAFLGLGILFSLVGLIIGLIATVFWIWMLIDCLLKSSLTGVEKLIWVLVILFTHILGAILYFVLVRGRATSRPLR